MTDNQIEQAIQAKGLTAPRITPADIEANIVGELYINAAEAAKINGFFPGCNDPLHLLTFCVLTLRNGHLVSGEAYCADPAKFNAETGHIEARKVAIDKLWPMVVYAERERLAAMDAVNWTVIDRSNPATLPPKGEWLVTVNTDDGREVQVLLHEGNGKWLHEGEYTFQHDYYFRPVAWAPRPEACSGPVPAED